MTITSRCAPRLPSGHSAPRPGHHDHDGSMVPQEALLRRAGESGPDALRQHRPFRLPAHRATSDVLGGAYPFLAEAGLGSEGVYIGQDAWSGGGFCFDPWELYQQGVLTNPNCLLAGVVGKGKSFLAKSLATRSIAFGRRVYVPGDPKGEWSVVADAVGGSAIRLGPGSANRLNPLDPGPRPTDLGTHDWYALVRSRRRTLLGSLAHAALGRHLCAIEHTSLDVALEAASQQAAALGYHPLILSSAIEGETREVAKVHAGIAKEVLTSGHPLAAPACILSGGETTVTLRGQGKGGRNQEFALAMALDIRDIPGIAVLSGGTDGTDGPTDAAGAAADWTTCTRAEQLSLQPRLALENNDAYPFFARLGDLLITGPTQTNVMDVRIMLIAPTTGP